MGTYNDGSCDEPKIPLFSRDGSVWDLWMPNPHYGRDPRALLWRLRHRLTGARRGCSCRTCFNDPRRHIPAREFNKVRFRLAELARRVDAIEAREAAASEMRNAGLTACSSFVRNGEWSITRGAEELERMRVDAVGRGELGVARRAGGHLATMRQLASRAGEGHHA